MKGFLVCSLFLLTGSVLATGSVDVGVTVRNGEVYVSYFADTYGNLLEDNVVVRYWTRGSNGSWGGPFGIININKGGGSNIYVTNHWICSSDYCSGVKVEIYSYDCGSRISDDDIITW